MSPSLSLGSPAAVAAAAAAVLAAGLTAAVLGPLGLVLGVAAIAAVFFWRYPLALLTGFVYLPLFESEPGLRDLPVDLTVILGAWLLVVCGHRALSGRVRRIPLPFALTMLGLGLALWLGLLWTPEPAYGLEKAGKFVTVTTLAAFAPFFLVDNARDLRRLLWWIAGAGLLVAAITPFYEPNVNPGVTSASSIEGRFAFGGQIFTARLIATAALIMLLAPAVTRARWRVLAPVAGAGAFFVALGLGSRGPILALVLALFATVAISAPRNPRQFLTVLAALAVGFAVFPLVSLPETSLQRVEGAAEDPIGTLAEDGRDALYFQAVELTRAHPLRGEGTGGYARYSAVLSRQELRYPHNVFLELSSELGIVVAVLFGASLLAMLSRLLRRAGRTANPQDRNLLFLVVGVFVLNLFAAQFSGDLNDNRTVWLLLGLGWLAGSFGNAPLRREDAGPGATVPAA